MPHSLATFGNDARQRLLAGVDVLAAAVRTTLGPKGRTVLIRGAFGPPKISNDGVTVARAVVPKDPVERAGAEVVREAAVKTSTAVGDGTTTAIVLAHAMIHAGVTAIAAGMNPMDLKRGIDMGVTAAVADIRARSRPVAGHEQILQVATIAANGDPEIGRLVTEAVEKVGAEGAVVIEEAKGLVTELEVVEGMQFDRGFLSPYFATSPDAMTCELEDALILIHDRKLSDLKSLLPVLEAVIQAGHPLLIICEDIDADVLATLVVNKLRGGLRVAAVKGPGFGDRRKAMLEDVAVLTGGQYVSEELGMKLQSVTVEQLGRARRVIVTKDDTTIVSGGGGKAAIEGRCAEIRKQIADATSDYDREKLQERLARLSGGVAVIRAGGATEIEVKERKDRIDDAVHATRAASEEGVLPGGGTALLAAAAALDALEPANPDQRTGIDIVRRALSAPLAAIAENAGAPGIVVSEKLREGRVVDEGFDAQAGRYVNLWAAGIIDPAKVARLALQNAASVAGMLITTEVLLIEQEDEPDRERDARNLEF